MTEIVELGHVGIHVADLPRMREFYTTVLGLTVTDEHAGRGSVFLSSRPGFEHHELVLAVGRNTPEDVKLVQQLSWRVGSVEGLQAIHRRLIDAGAEIKAVITHGNALGVYFRDPENNHCEVYVHTGLDVHQPFRHDIALQSGTAQELLAENRRIVDEARTAAQ
jgi:catechol-2,3-dioxygenase